MFLTAVLSVIIGMNLVTPNSVKGMIFTRKDKLLFGSKLPSL